MGYYMGQQDSDFCIKKDNISKALEAVVNWAKEVERDTLYGIKRLDDAFSDFGFNVQYDEGGNITEIFFEYGKLTKQDEFLFELAPFVEDGSYIQMIGEDNSMWRWIFRDGNFEEILPKIIWE